MAYFNSPVRDWTVKLPPGVRTATKKVGDKTLQQGTVSFGRKKKNGCRLASSAEIRQSIRGNLAKRKIVNCAAVFPPMPIHEGEVKPAAKVVVFVKKPGPPPELKIEKPNVDCFVRP